MQIYPHLKKKLAKANLAASVVHFNGFIIVLKTNNTNKCLFTTCYFIKIDPKQFENNVSFQTFRHNCCGLSKERLMANQEGPKMPAPSPL